MKTVNPEQFLLAGKSTFDAYVALAAKSFEGFQKLAELNVNVAKAAVAESTAAVQQLSSIKDPQAFIAFATAQAKPNAEKVAAYGRAVYDIVSTSGAEFTQAAEAQVAKANEDTAAFIETLTKNAPAGSEAAVTALKTMVAAGNTAFENINRATKSAVASAKTQVERAANASVKAAAA